MVFNLEGIVSTKSGLSKEEFTKRLEEWIKDNGWEYCSNTKANTRFLPNTSNTRLTLSHSSVIGAALFGKGKNEHDNRRYYLSKIWDPELPVAAAFLMNPSYATDLSGDNTVDFLIEYLKQYNFGSLIVVNTSSVIKSSNADENDFPLNDDTNKRIISKVVIETDMLILGWGEKGNKYAVPHFSSELKILLRENEEKIYIFDILGKRTSTRRQLYPCHPSPVGDKNKYKKTRLINIKEHPLYSLRDLLS